MPPSLAYTPALTKIMADDYAPGTSAHALGEIQRDNWVVPRVLDDQGNPDPDRDGKAVIQTFFNEIVKLTNEGSSSLIGGLESGDEMSTAALATISSLLTNQLSKAFRFYYATGPYYTGSSSTYLSLCKNLGATFPKVDLESFFTNFFIFLSGHYVFIN